MLIFAAIVPIALTIMFGALIGQRWRGRDGALAVAALATPLALAFWFACCFVLLLASWPEGW